MTKQESLTKALDRLRAARGKARNTAERKYIGLLEQQLEQLLRRDPKALLRAALSAPLGLLHLPQHRLRLRYYRAIGAGLHDRFARALRHLRALLPNPDLEPETRGRVLNAIGLFSRHSGQYQDALDSYEHSVQIWKQLGNPLRQGIALNNLGALHYELRAYTEAEDCFHKAVGLFTAASSGYHQAQAYNELGLLCRDRGQWGRAQSYLDQAAALCQHADAPELLARITNNQGEIALLCGRYDEALALFEQAKAGMASQAYVVDVHINCGLIAQARNDQAAALASYRAALDLAQGIRRTELIPLIHERIGSVQQRQGEPSAALESYAAAAKAVDERYTPLRDETLLIGIMGRWQQVFEAAILLCLEQGDLAGAFDYAERARARAFANMLARNGTDLPAEQITPVTLAEAQDALTPSDLLLVYFATGLRGPETELLTAMDQQAAGLRDCLTPPARLVALAVTHNQIAYADCQVDPNDLQATSNHGADGRRFLDADSLQGLDELLLAPFAAAISAAERVIIVPHGPLHQVPFAALADAQGTSLLERVERLQLVPSATALLRVLDSRRGTPSVPCLALGYDSPQLQLRHCAAEAHAVAGLLGGHLATGQHATELLRQHAGNSRVLHLACHGEFNLDNPLRSCLEIAPQTFLTAESILAGYRLQADLVTLSACRSGVSLVLRGDEPMGLARAFLIAGARAVLVTLWPVDDGAARLLMEHFYQHLASGQDAAAALRCAQQYLRSANTAQLARTIGERNRLAGATHPTTQPFADPQHWAGYVLIGAS